MKTLPVTSFLRKQFLFGLLFIVFISCNKSSTDKFVSYKQYVSFHPGKFFIYELDSMVTLPFGTAFVTHSYIIKDSIIDTIYDNQGRAGFRVFRYLKNTNGEWVSDNETFWITPTDNSLEYVENNLKYIKMVNSVSSYTNWQGNAYIDISPFSFDPNFPYWDYGYSDIGVAKSFNGINYPNTVTVIQYDSTLDLPFYKYGYLSHQEGYEVYADSIGMVYKDLVDWEYQVLTTVYNCKHVKLNSNGIFDTTSIDCVNNNCDSIANVDSNKIIGCDTSIVNSYYDGYGIKQILLSHN